MGNFDFNPSWMKKEDVQQPNNYVEITPEQQAEIDKANAAKDNAALAQGLSGNNSKDLSKGVSIEKQQPVRTETGNGITRITNPDGTVEFEIDYAKGYDGTPQMFAKGTKVTYLNAPEGSKKSLWAKIGDVIDSVNEWGNRVTGGQIRSLGRGIATMGGAAVAAGGAAALGGTAVAGGALVKGGGALIGAAALASCSDIDIDTPPDPNDQPDAGAKVEITNKDIAQNVIDGLNNPQALRFDNPRFNYDGERYLIDTKTGNRYDLSTETDDGVGFKYGFDYDPKTDKVSPYITLGEDDNKIKLPINVDKLQGLTAENIVDYINIIGDEFGTADNIDYNFQLNNSKAEVVFGNGDKTISLPLNPKGNINDTNVVDYINIIGDELSTADGVNYNFEVADNKAQVVFGNGLTHTVGDDVTLDPNGTTSKLSSMLASVNLAQPEQNSTKIAMGLENGQGSYGNGTPGFGLEIVTPANLRDITSGNPRLKGNVADYNFEGATEQVQAGTLQLEVNGKTISNAQNGIIIKNANGDEVYMQQEQNFDLQSQWDEPGADYNLYDGVVVYVKEAGSDVFKEKYIMSKFDDTHTDIGIIDRENGAIIQNYPSTMTTFDTQGAIDADNYFNEKEVNLVTSYNDADNYYKQKEGNLNDAYKNADKNFKVLYNIDAEANADVDIQH